VPGLAAIWILAIVLLSFSSSVCAFSFHRIHSHYNSPLPTNALSKSISGTTTLGDQTYFQQCPQNLRRCDTLIHPCKSSTSLSMIGAGAASLLAGSVGGAIGVGVAYPLDTLKTKSQVFSQQRQKVLSDNHQQTILQNQLLLQQRLLESGQNGTITLPPPGTVHSHSGNTYPIESPEDDLISLVKLILELEGIAGFFGGVKAMMIGQALIKSVAFSANDFALRALNDMGGVGALTGAGDLSGGEGGAGASSFATLLLAAAFSGFVTSFLVAPVERVKVMMQAQQNSLYANELECVRAVLQNEGWTGLFSRGLGPTLVREVPSYGIYFVVYGVLMQTAVAENLGSVAPLIFGAISGCACWIPVYPVDVVKTLVQNTEGGADDSSAIDVAIQLYKDEGVGAFFNGLTPKMLRASVNHAVTFWVYDLMMGVLT